MVIRFLHINHLLCHSIFDKHPPPPPHPPGLGKTFITLTVPYYHCNNIIYYPVIPMYICSFCTVDTIARNSNEVTDSGFQAHINNVYIRPVLKIFLLGVSCPKKSHKVGRENFYFI